jgi:hypothetical protein
MTKDKKHNKPQRRNLAMHSKKTGALILVGLVVFLVGGSAFMVLAYLENEKFEIELQTFLTLSCDDMKKDFMNLEKWQHEAYILKIRGGDCTGTEPININSCPDLLMLLDQATPTERQRIHDEIKKAGC